MTYGYKGTNLSRWTYRIAIAVLGLGFLRSMLPVDRGESRGPGIITSTVLVCLGLAVVTAIAKHRGQKARHRQEEQRKHPTTESTPTE